MTPNIPNKNAAGQACLPAPQHLAGSVQATMTSNQLQRAITAAETYWRDVLKLPGVPNVEARDVSNYTIVDNYLMLKRIEAERVKYNGKG